MTWSRTYIGICVGPDTFLILPLVKFTVDWRIVAWLQQLGCRHIIVWQVCDERLMCWDIYFAGQHNIMPRSGNIDKLQLDTLNWIVETQTMLGISRQLRKLGSKRWIVMLGNSDRATVKLTFLHRQPISRRPARSIDGKASARRKARPP